MSETIETPVEQEQQPQTAPVADSERVPGEEALGDPGKRALDAMKQERNTARQQAREAAERITELEAQLQQSGSSTDERVSKLEQQLLNAEVRAAAKGRFNDPADVLKGSSALVRGWGRLPRISR